MKRKILTIKEASQLIDGITEYRIRLSCFRAGKKYLISEEVLYKAVFGEPNKKSPNPFINEKETEKSPLPPKKVE